MQKQELNPVKAKPVEDACLPVERGETKSSACLGWLLVHGFLREHECCCAVAHI